MREIDREEWLDLVMQEYDYHRTAIDKFDAQRLQIRNWAITVSAGIIAVSLTTDTGSIAAGGILTTLLFGWLEATYMTWQSDVIDRSDYLEGLINAYRADGHEPEDYQFGISHAYTKHASWRRMARALLNRSRLHVTAFYAVLLVAGVAAAVLINLT